MYTFTTCSRKPQSGRCAEVLTDVESAYTRMVEVSRVTANGESDSRAGSNAESRGRTRLSGVIAANVGRGDVGHLLVNQ